MRAERPRLAATSVEGSGCLLSRAAACYFDRHARLVCRCLFIRARAESPPVVVRLVARALSRMRATGGAPAGTRSVPASSTAPSPNNAVTLSRMVMGQALLRNAECGMRN